MVDLAVLGKQLDSIILEVFFNLNDSMILFSMVTLPKITIHTIIDKITRTENVAKKPYERHLKISIPLSDQHTCKHSLLHMKIKPSKLSILNHTTL